MAQEDAIARNQDVKKNIANAIIQVSSVLICATVINARTENQITIFSRERYINLGRIKKSIYNQNTR